jgi:hypothetical protein
MKIIYNPEKSQAYNSTCKKLVVQRLNEALCFVSSIVLVDSIVHQNLPERKAQKH